MLLAPEILLNSPPPFRAGNFQDREKMRVEKTIRLRFGRFFYRFPDGESAADVYDRVTGQHPFCQGVFG